MLRAALPALVLLLVVVPAGPGSAQATWDVAVEDVAFNPDRLVIHAGDAVVWTVGGVNEHTITALDGSFNSGDVFPGDTYAHTFALPGVVPYYCQYHLPRMVAHIVVLP